MVLANGDVEWPAGRWPGLVNARQKRGTEDTNVQNEGRETYNLTRHSHGQLEMKMKAIDHAVISYFTSMQW